jgi:uncharacterized protein (TIGR02246 family)
MTTERRSTLLGTSKVDSGRRSWMGKIVGRFVLMGIFAALPLGCVETEAEHISAEGMAVRALLERQIDAWSEGSGTSFAATYTDDGDLTVFDGTHIVGRQAIASFMQVQFDGFLKGTRVLAEPKRIRFIDDSVAVMITQGGVVFPGETAVPAERFSIQTFVVTRSNGEWLFTAFQNTRIAPMGAGE